MYSRKKDKHGCEYEFAAGSFSTINLRLYVDLKKSLAQQPYGRDERVAIITLLCIVILNGTPGISRILTA
jgi:hypothetical protein